VKRILELTFTGASEALKVGQQWLNEYPKLILELKTKSGPAKGISVMYVLCVSETAYDELYRLVSNGNGYNSATVSDHVWPRI
jgi:hypothetical protein